MKVFNYVEPQIFSLGSFSGSSGTTGVGHLQTRGKKKSVLSGKHDIHHLLVWVLFLGYTVKQGSWPLQHPRSRISGCTWQGRAPLVATSPRVPCCSTRSPSSSPFFFSWRFQTGAQVNEPGGGSQAKDKRAQDAERCSCGVSIPKRGGRGKKDAKDPLTHLLPTTASKCCLGSHCTLGEPP